MDRNLQIESVLRCGICNKPFDKPSTLKRHGYYCRSRKSGPALTSKSRSCISCAKRKARCDQGRPGCSRCLAKRLECRYPTPATGTGSRPRARHNSGAPLLLTDSGSSTESYRDAEDHDDGALDTALAIASSDLNLDPFGVPEFGNGDFFNWDDPALDLSFSDLGFLNSDFIPIPQTTKQYPPIHATQIPPSILSLPRLIIRRPSETPGKTRTTSLILHTLKSYLLILMRHNGLPPFIHPSSIPAGTHDGNSPIYNPLVTCLTLIKALNSRRQDKRKLFWDHVRSECDRMMNIESHQGNGNGSQTLHRWNLLGAMQALSIYVVIRLDEGETEENNVDFLLLGAVTVIARQLSNDDTSENRRNQGAFDSDGDSTIGWQEWLYEESRRRLAVIYHIIKMLVYFEPAAKCDLPTDLLLAPLPAKKQLWEASSEEIWKAGAQGEQEMHRTAFGLAVSGELVRLDQSRGEDELSRRDAVLSHMALDAATVSRSAADWEEWCSGMDGFGGLVMLVASLVT